MENSSSNQRQIQHPATREGDQDTGTSTSEQSQIQHPATREGDQDTGTSTSEQSQIQHPATREGDQDTGTSTSEQSQIQHPATREGDQDTGTSTSEQSQIQHPATREGDQDTGTSTSEQSQIQHPATREGDQDTGTSTSEQSQIQQPATREGDQDTGTSTREQSQIQHPATREGDQDTGSSTREQSQIQHPATREGDQDTGTSTREATHSPRDVILENNTSIERNTDPNSTITDFLTKCDDYQLFKLMKFYRDRLEQAIEEGVEGLSLILKEEDHFTGQEHQKVTELVEKGNRTDSSKLLLNLVMEKDSRVQRLMWKSFVKMCHRLPKLYKMLKEIQELGCDSFDYMDIARGLSEIPSHLKANIENHFLSVLIEDVQQKHKETLQVQTETLRVNTILIKEKVKIFQLVDRYAELTVISTVRDRTLVEHELLVRGRDHEEWREKHLRRELEKIRTDQLFQSSFSWGKSKSGSSAAVSGAPGIGKTTMVQKIVHDWATGKIYTNFQFVFSFKFRDLNTINCRINLRNLILDQYPYFGNVLGELWKNPEGLLFIFDGLDEFKDMMDFGDDRRNTEPQYMCTDPECCCEVSDIVYSLMQHKLLPGCSVLVTSRPTALHLLEKAEISVWAEILGFVGDERKEYFNKFFEDQTVAAAVFKHVEENEILYTMCYNPSYCWILCLSLGPFFTQRDRKQQQVPKTITQLYSYYIYNILKNHSREIENPRDVLLKIGEMAFTGVSEKKIVFRDGDLIEYNLQPSQFLSGFLMELLERDDSVQNVVYTFPHLTIQEFVAALAQFLTAGRGDIRNLLSEAHSEEDGRFEIFLRFVAGLSSPQAARPLEEFLGPFPHQTTCQVIDWVKETVKGQIGKNTNVTGKRNLLNTLHYLFESQNKALVQDTVGSMDTLKFSGLRLTPIDYAVLSHVIGLCDTIKNINLYRCDIQCEGFQRLSPVLHKFQVLRLNSNNLGDSGVKLLSAALRNPDCKIQKLDLGANNLTDSCIEDLASALSTNRSLTALDLSDNNLGDSGVKLRSEALRNPDCKIQELWLGGNNLTDSCIEDLVSALSTNQSLTDLNLCGNNLGDSRVKLLSEALRNPDCKIQKLYLGENDLTAYCIKDLASALNTNRSLTELDLSCNKLGDSGVKLLSEALRSPDCKIQELWLVENNLTASCIEDLASALNTNRSLTDLDLNYNELGGSGVKLLSEALRNPDCKIQKLGLVENNLSDSCIEDLASALSSNRSLTDLDLSYNKLGDSGVKLLSEGLRNPDCKIQKLQLENNKLTDSCIKDLASALSTNQSLTDLDLNDNELGDSGVKLLSEALRNPDCKIQELDLRDVGLTDSCAEDLASALSTNQSLTFLNLTLNSFTDRSVPALSCLILNCRSLEQIWGASVQFKWRESAEVTAGYETRTGCVCVNISICKHHWFLHINIFGQFSVLPL
ncbi:NACHT, LRR and PYD domains-containing protein 12-like isoform X4 [Heterodontus francisci]|uniref:NACHT, LRR and PYD domains-containing protein 12-like isoform X4 n=1 Tax=Heterodontus francisci TaxID=7792 RepID=UPI00355B6DD5